MVISTATAMVLQWKNGIDEIVEFRPVARGGGQGGRLHYIE